MPLTTRQFFLVALAFGLARLVAAMGAEQAGAELAVLEWILGIVCVLWVIQAHAAWVRIVRFDVLLAWFAVYSAVAFGFGNYFHAGFAQLAGSQIATALVGGGLLAYHLSQARTEKALLSRLPGQAIAPLLAARIRKL